MKKLYTCLCYLSTILLANPVSPQSSITYQSFIAGLTVPVEVANAADGTARLFVVQQNGIIKVYDPANAGLQTTPFLDVSSIVTYGDERGLLSLAFHPAFETNGYFFIYYNNTAGDITIARYHATGTANVADAGGDVLLAIPKPYENHNGGHLQFAKDSTLYFATGDGGSGNDPGNRSQDPTSLLGKMLRINVSVAAGPPYYTVPADNPFYNTPGFDNRIWARGLRNPYRWSFDRLTGDMWIGDVGQGAKEEIDFRPASSTGGENYGWRCYEGSIRTPGITPCDPPDYFPPVFDYDNPSSGSSSVIGGYVYRGTEYPFFYGYYVAADVYSGTVYILQQNGNSFTVSTKTGLQNFVVGFGEGEDGTLYAVSQGTGTVYKVVPAITLPVTLSRFSGRRAAGGNELNWSTASEQSITKFEVEYSTDGNRFMHVGEITASGNNNGKSYSYLHSQATTGAAYYRLKIVERDGSSTYSSIIKLNDKEGGYQIYPTIVHNGILYINAAVAADKIQLLTNDGRVVFEKDLRSSLGQITVHLPALARGIYIVRITGASGFAGKIRIE